MGTAVTLMCMRLKRLPLKIVEGRLKLLLQFHSLGSYYFTLIAPLCLINPTECHVSKTQKQGGFTVIHSLSDRIF